MIKPNMIPKRNYFKKYTNDEIIDFIKNSNSASEMVIKMGYDPSQRSFVKRFSEEYNISIDHFSRINQRTHSLNENFFSDMNQISIYWLGFIMADGNIRNINHEHSLKVQLAEKDMRHLEVLKNDLNYSGKLRYNDPHIMTAKGHSYQSQASFTLQVSSKKMIHDLVSLDCVQNKTQLGTQISNKIPNDLLSHFIRGYFDGDGSIVIEKRLNKGDHQMPSISIFILGSEKILEQIATIISEFVGVNKPNLSARQGVYCIKWSGNEQCFKIFDWLYHDASRFLERKYQKYINHKSFYVESKKAKNKKYIDAAKKATNWKNFFELIGLNPQKIGLKQRKRITEILLQENFNFSDSCLTPEP